MDQGASEGVHAVAAAMAAAAMRGTLGEGGRGTNMRRGYEQSPRDGTNDNERAQGDCGEYEQVREGLNERRGYKRSPTDGTHENERE